MPAFPAPLDNLIAYVRNLQPDGGPLDRLSDAVTAADELNEQADALIGYFVDQARSSGAPWSQIGAAMGVSKQAAQKRFVARDDEPTSAGKAFSRFTPRARAAVAAAGQLAHAAGEDEVGVASLVAGCLDDNGGIAARAVERLEVDVARVYETLGWGPAQGGSDADPTALRQLHFAASCRSAFKEALKVALRLGHNYIGTEHLLLGAVAAGGDVAQRLSAVGLSEELLDSAVAVELAELQLLPRRRPT